MATNEIKPKGKTSEKLEQLKNKVTDAVSTTDDEGVKHPHNWKSFFAGVALGFALVITGSALMGSGSDVGGDMNL